MMDDGVGGQLEAHGYAVVDGLLPPDLADELLKDLRKTRRRVAALVEGGELDDTQDGNSTHHCDHSPLTAHRSPLTAHRSPSAAYRSQHTHTASSAHRPPLITHR